MSTKKININDIKNILDENIRPSTKCGENDCKIDDKNVISIYSPENDGIPKKVKKELRDSSGNYKACDCILLCNNGKILIVEILCGILSKRELEDKIQQVENCKTIIKHLKLSKFLKKSYIIYEKKGKNIMLTSKFLETKSRSLNKKGILLHQYNKINTVSPCADSK